MIASGIGRSSSDALVVDRLDHAEPLLVEQVDRLGVHLELVRDPVTGRQEQVTHTDALADLAGRPPVPLHGLACSSEVTPFMSISPDAILDAHSRAVASDTLSSCCEASCWIWRTPDVIRPALLVSRAAGTR